MMDDWYRGDDESARSYRENLDRLAEGYECPHCGMVPTHRQLNHGRCPCRRTTTPGES